MSVSFFHRQLANIVSVLRIIGVVLIFFLVPFQDVTTQLWTILIFILISSSDYLDGWLARRLNIVTDIGKVLDPLADKILVLVFLPLLLMQVITAFPVFIILTREFAIMALRVLSAKDGTIISASTSGKFKTALTLPLCGILFGRVIVDKGVTDIPFFLTPLYEVMTWVQVWPQWMISALIWATVLVTVWSFVDYLVGFIWAKCLLTAKGDRELAKLSLKRMIPNTVTMCNLCLGLVATVLAYLGMFGYATLLILICIFLDGMDGRIARKLGVSSDLGAKLDSRADHISFGVAPGMLIYQMGTLYSFPFSEFLAPVLGLLYYGAVHYRLARFDKSGGHSDVFTGLPSPVGAAVVIVLPVTYYLSQSWVFIPIVCGVSYLMVSTIPYLHTQASKRTVLRYLHAPTLVFMALSVVALLPLPIEWLASVKEFPIYALFLVVMGYVASPLYVKR